MRLTQLALAVSVTSFTVGATFVACGSTSETPTPDAGGVDAGNPDAAVDSGVSTPDTSTTCVLSDGGVGAVCGDKCVDPATDPLHCGTCATACTPGSICQNGCVDIAGSLQGLRWNLPCVAPNSATVCVTNPATTISATLKGSTGVTYAVTLRMRGIVEEKTYVGGSVPDGGVAAGGTNSSLFVVGGTPASDDWNVYKLAVSSPAMTAYLNNGTSAHYYVDPLDYTVTVLMQGGATVTLTADPSDNGPYEIKNVSLEDGGTIVVPGVPPAPNAFDGQFIQMDVVSVVPAP